MELNWYKEYIISQRAEKIPYKIIRIVNRQYDIPKKEELTIIFAYSDKQALKIFYNEHPEFFKQSKNINIRFAAVRDTALEARLLEEKARKIEEEKRKYDNNDSWRDE